MYHGNMERRDGFSPEGTYKFPNEDGVYVIAQVLDDGTYNVRYVGPFLPNASS